ncbi:MAG: serine/threonine-protein kinase [Acidimicrobiales bacterium]
MRFQPGQLIDHYEVLAPLGEGAYAETYQARDGRSGEVVVLKCPNPLLFADPGLFQRFRRETEIAHRLNHPGVQRSLDAGDHRTEPYLVLEYVEGENLRRRLRPAEGLISIPTALDWGHQLADALAYLHANGITHRDLKPENILVDADGHLKIADFGTAMLTGARRLTWRHLSESLGTPDYMSPEQVQGARGDARSDIYSWGVMMYELLTGRVPFEGDNWLAVMAGHLTGTPQRIRSLRPEVSPALEAVVLTAMRRQPEHRYPSADALVADLDRLDVVDPASFDLSPELPIGGMAAAGSARRLWALVGMIAGAFVAVVVLILTLTVVLR